MISYEEILQNMKSAYFEESNMYPDMNSNVGARLKAVASELCNLSAQTDFALKQSSWKTATGSFLDAIANECSLERRSGSRASGELTFMIDEPSENDIDIPLGTICCKSNKRYIQYATVERGKIRAGMTFCTVKAQALFNGEEYNAWGNEICVMVTPPSFVDSVNNYKKWSGGFDDESDEVLRSRIKNRLKYPARAMNVEFERGLIESISTVHSCNIVFEEDDVYAYVRTYSNVLDNETEEKVSEILSYYNLMGKNVVVSIARPHELTLRIHYTGNESPNRVEKKIYEYCACLRVGDDISCYDLKEYLLACGLDIKSINIYCDNYKKTYSGYYPVVYLKEVVQYE